MCNIGPYRPEQIREVNELRMRAGGNSAICLALRNARHGRMTGAPAPAAGSPPLERLRHCTAE
jgi:hypothetical protein